MTKGPRWERGLVLGALTIAIATTIHLLRATPVALEVDPDKFSIWGRVLLGGGPLLRRCPRAARPNLLARRATLDRLAIPYGERS